MKKWFLWVLFFCVFGLSIYTSNFPYPEHSRNPNIGFVCSLLAVISFLVVAWVYAGSKRFLIVVSIYFAYVLAFKMIANGLDDTLITLLLWLPVLLFEIPLMPVNKLFEICGFHMTEDLAFYVLFAVIIVLVYAVYFIGKKQKKTAI